MGSLDSDSSAKRCRRTHLFAGPFHSSRPFVPSASSQVLIFFSTTSDFLGGATPRQQPAGKRRPHETARSMHIGDALVLRNSSSGSLQRRSFLSGVCTKYSTNRGIWQGFRRSHFADFYTDINVTVRIAASVALLFMNSVQETDSAHSANRYCATSGTKRIDNLCDLLLINGTGQCLPARVTQDGLRVEISALMRSGGLLGCGLFLQGWQVCFYWVQCWLADIGEVHLTQTTLLKLWPQLRRSPQQIL